MSFIEFLSESTVKDILKEEKIFVMIIGGSASGKNYIYEKQFSSLPLADIDAHTTKLSGGDFELARKFVSKAAAIVKKELLQSFSDGKSIVNVGTGGGVPSTLNKFKWAKEAGLKTAVVLVDVPLKTALKRNQERAGKGKQGLIPDWKVEKANTSARDNFKIFKKETDYSIIIKN